MVIGAAERYDLADSNSQGVAKWRRGRSLSPIVILPMEKTGVVEVLVDELNSDGLPFLKME